MGEYQEAVFASLAAVAVVAVGSWSVLRESRMSIRDRVIRCFVLVTGIPADSITPELSKDDLGMDSTDQVELIIALEDEFNIEIPDEVIDKFMTVRGIISYIHLRVGITTKGSP